MVRGRSRSRSSRRLRTLRGGGTTSYGFVSPPDFYRSVNNGFALTDVGSGGPPNRMATPHEGGGLPGLSTGPGPSLQKGGGGGTHYGFQDGSGLFGGVRSIPSNCALPQSGGAGHLNVPVDRSPLGTMAGGRRRRVNKRNTKNKKSKSKKLSRRR